MLKWVKNGQISENNVQANCVYIDIILYVKLVYVSHVIVSIYIFMQI